LSNRLATSIAYFHFSENATKKHALHIHLRPGDIIEINGVFFAEDIATIRQRLLDIWSKAVTSGG
jgi:hypothetical protein